MTPTELEAAMRRAGVGQYENMTGKPYPYKSRLEEAEAIVAELGADELLLVAEDFLAATVDYLEPANQFTESRRNHYLRTLDALEAALAAAEPAKEGAE